MITEPLKCLTHAEPFPEFGEHELNRFRDSSIGMQNDLTQRVKSVSDWEPFEQLATARFGLLPGEQSLAYDLEFDDTERPFDT